MVTSSLAYRRNLGGLPGSYRGALGLIHSDTSTGVAADAPPAATDLTMVIW